MLDIQTTYPLYGNVAINQFFGWAKSYVVLFDALAVFVGSKISAFHTDAEDASFLKEANIATTLLRQLGKLISGETMATSSATLLFDPDLGEDAYTDFTISYWEGTQVGNAIFSEIISGVSGDDIAATIASSLNKLFNTGGINAFAELVNDPSLPDGEAKILITAAFTYDGMRIVVSENAAEAFSLSVPDLEISQTDFLGSVKPEDLMYASLLCNHLYSILGKYCRDEDRSINSLFGPKECALAYAISSEKYTKNNATFQSGAYFVPGDFLDSDFIIS